MKLKSLKVLQMILKAPPLHPNLPHGPGGSSKDCLGTKVISKKDAPKISCNFDWFHLFGTWQAYEFVALHSCSFWALVEGAWPEPRNAFVVKMPENMDTWPLKQPSMVLECFYKFIILLWQVPMCFNCLRCLRSNSPRGRSWIWPSSCFCTGVLAAYILEHCRNAPTWVPQMIQLQHTGCS
jgi:hypothetical protein